MKTGASQLTVLPWTNINTISVQFNENVNIDASLLATILSGNSSAATPPVDTVTYNSTAFVATFTLGSTLTADTYMLTIPTGSVTDSLGADLDGAFINHSSTATGQSFPSGNSNGVDSNSDFNFLFDVLPGAVTQAPIVSSTDFTKIRDQTLEGPTVTTGNLLPFSPYADVNGSSLIISTQVTLVRNALLSTLPTGTPPSPSAKPDAIHVSAPVANDLSVSTNVDIQASSGPASTVTPAVATAAVVTPSVGLMVGTQVATASSIAATSVSATTPATLSTVPPSWSILR